MDFFEHQERARKNTLLLVFFFIAAVILILLAVYAVLALSFLGGPQPAAGADWLVIVNRLWDPYLFMWTAIGTLMIIFTGTAYKMSLLSSGGEAVARMFGATRIGPQTSLPAERRLLNVVDEISIAAGMPAPAVYVLDDGSINAFAAGFSSRDAIIGVTRGCMNLLSRDELQAVIAHEFSHILNGDMRLNIRLMGVLHGILLISLIGWWIFRISTQSSRSALGRSSGKKGGGGTVVILLAGLALMIIGYIGVFFTRLIKAAVSRQREFLADAASVQFTRNPGGMTGALKKIGGLINQGQIDSPNAEEASHLFFANGLKSSFFNLMATHPPLAERVRRIDPAFDGTFPPTAARPSLFIDDETPVKSGLAESTASPYAGAPTGSRSIALASAKALNAVGRMDAGALADAARWLASLPPDIRGAAREPGSAQALIMAMLVSGDDKIRGKQIEYLKENLDDAVYNSLLALIPLAENCPHESFLPLADLAASTLRSLRASELNNFVSQLRRLVEADGSITLFEYMLQSLVAAHIRSWTGRRSMALFSSSDTGKLLPAMLVVLSTLAAYGSENDDAAGKAFDAALKKLPAPPATRILPREQCGLQQVDRALAALVNASPGIKKNFLEACLACVVHDGKTSVNEAELLRAVAAILDCPAPPLLPSSRN
jgi:Zn-dependent protease with chaperone function/uncharacterized tellurite resistance protein B-like protein